MPEPGSVSIWLKKLPQDKQEAWRQLWERYFEKLVTFVRNKLRNGPRAARDEEDIALSAFNSFCRNAEKGRFPKLNDRDDLWQILVTMTKRKLYDHIEHETAQKRDWRRNAKGANAGEPLLVQLINDEPSPDFAAEIADSYRHLLEILGEEKYRRVALLKFAGHTNVEIAKEIDRTERTVSHRLETIRAIWKPLLDSH